MSIRIVIADDHPIFRAGLARSIAESGAFEVVGEAGSADESGAQVEALSPDLVLLDISMPGSGIAAAGRMATQFP